jgi:hypothetical protein
LTPIDQYTDAVLDPIPARARAIGSVQFGIEHPKRIQLVQFWDALELLLTAAPDVQQKLAPDYIIWSDSEAANSANALMQLSGAPEAEDVPGKNSVGPWRVSLMFSQSRYQLLSLTNGAPYGTTRVYGWTRGMPALPHPLVGVYDPETKQWRRGLGTPEALATTPAAAAVVRGGAKPAVQTLTASAPAGLYLLRVDIAEASLGSGAGLVVVASATQELPPDVAQPTSGVDVSPWFAGEDAVYLVYRHAGGSFFVSQFGTGTPALGAITASPILSLTDYTEARRAAPADIPLPAAQWGPSFPTYIKVTPGEGGMRVEGDATLYGYQAYGPHITVRPGDRMRLRVPVTVTQGRGCLGVLDETLMRWLLAPETLLPEYEFTINDSSFVMPVLADCSGAPNLVKPFRATIGDGSYALWSTTDELYVDQLVDAFRSSPRK